MGGDLPCQIAVQQPAKRLQDRQLHGGRLARIQQVRKRFPRGLRVEEAEEPDGRGFLFGSRRSINRLDISAGTIAECARLTGDFSPIRLAFSADGTALGVVSQERPSDPAKLTRSWQSSWEIWSYPRLRDTHWQW